MTGTEQPTQFSFPTVIGGSIKFLVGITNPLRNHKENQKDPTIQPTIMHYNKTTKPGHSGQDCSPLGSSDSGTDVTISRQNIDNHTGMNPKESIMTIILDTHSAKNCNIFDTVGRTLNIAYRGYPWNGAEKRKRKPWRQQHFRKC